MATDPKPRFKTVDDSPLQGLIGDSRAMREVYQLTRKFSCSSASVLLMGETGTGKELIASALHRLSQRSAGPFVRVNCGALSETLLDSELFGHAKGSFTDAVKDRTGRFEAANGGTIFLDEINSTSTKLQVKLLRVLQEKELQRVGDSETISVDVRVIAGSNCDLTTMVADGNFREDLFWRLNVLPIRLPTLRRRENDVELLVRYFLDFYAKRNEKVISKIDPAAMQMLVDYQWPGNVRELQNYVERAVVLAESDVLDKDLLPSAVTGNTEAAKSAVFRPTDDQSLIREFVYNRISKAEADADDLHKQIVDPVEKELIAQVMENCNQTQTKAAQRLGINRNTLYKKLVEHGLAKQNAKNSGEQNGKQN
jgi:DNA-binding NtrC family response regulator